MIKQSFKSIRTIFRQKQLQKLQYNFSNQQQQDQQQQQSSQSEQQSQQNKGRENETYEEKLARYQRIEQQRLKFIGITASLGGGMIGYCIASFLRKQETDKEDKEDDLEEQQELIQKQELESQWDNNWDGLQHLVEQEKEQEQKTKRGTRYITLIRHGQYEQVEEDDKMKLTKLGREQAKATGKRLKELDLKFDKVYTSKMIRAIETSDIIGKELNLKKNNVDIIEDGLLSEGSPCKFSPVGKNGQKYLDKYYSEEDVKRIAEGFEKYIKRVGENQEGDSHELFVIHGNVIRYILTRALQNPTEGWLRFGINNCGITQLQIRPDGYVSLRRLGETGHMDKKHQSYS